ncbi:uracil-xanthine permease family protein [Actinomadura madurae]|uniref:uracil-xanthine permease family protein n=1 Tax=Actinomadura madurae TaxID=1993 RepID=UPI0020D22CC4|nr:solute carrier family 23 protein [Actinomadura madurae]MCP9954918.1 nitrate reductase [Actinomadura madurae]MCP9971660.1 nitrate reductase [Actinomadura madurae]MCP9984156.1 nitrate reductase [Actinomadura madurae]MCQ0004287.1 nitrate reductase [Actinomadura madurae]
MVTGWKLHGDGRTPPPGEVVRPDERLSWPRTAGIGAQHVVAMFGATFVFPIVMGLDPNLAIMMSGVATILFLLIVGGRVPSYLGTSASFVGAVAAIRAAGGDSATVTGAILVSGLVLAAVGVLIHFVGGDLIHRVFPPVVTGAVVMLIGFNLAPVVATVYWPQDQWVALATLGFAVLCAVLLRGFWARITILLALVFGFALSWVLDQTAGKITSVLPGQNLLDGTGKACTAEGPYCVATAFPHDRVDFTSVKAADWFGFPSLHSPDLKTSAVLLALPAVIALIAENTGHVKAVAAMTRDDLDPVLGRAIAADGVGTALATSVGGSPTTTYAENIGVMAATRIYSTAAYYFAALVAILFGLCPKFGALVAATPGGVLGGITVVLYGMIGLLGAKIWVENRVDFGDPVNLVPVAAAVILAIGNVTLQITDDFPLQGIALGTIAVLLGYHVLNALRGPDDSGGGIIAPAETEIGGPTR